MIITEKSSVLTEYLLKNFPTKLIEWRKPFSRNTNSHFTAIRDLICSLDDRLKDQVNIYTSIQVYLFETNNITYVQHISLVAIGFNRNIENIKWSTYVIPETNEESLGLYVLVSDYIENNSTYDLGYNFVYPK